MSDNPTLLEEIEFMIDEIARESERLATAIETAPRPEQEVMEEDLCMLVAEHNALIVHWRALRPFAAAAA